MTIPDTPTSPTNAPQRQPWEEQSLRGRVLFVEDSQTSAAVTVHYLEQFGLQVRHVTTAEQALEVLGFEFDLVLSDFFLDGQLTGLDLVERIRARNDDLSLLPVLVLTSAEETDHRIGSLRAGANDFIYKPFHPEELYARLRNLLALRHAYKKLYTQKKAMERLSVTDGLTNLYNKRFLNGEAPAILGRAQRSGHPLALLVMDLDHFKHINDTYGHDHGDRTLKMVAEALEEEFQEVDLIARYGGEEFVVVLDRADRAQAALRGERLRQRLADLPLDPPVTASVGITAQHVDEPVRDFDQLFREADRALYGAKDSGRDRVAVWEWTTGQAEVRFPA
ncbi:MAG: diguanylate cyclase [Thiohalorhabdus sp.]|uniref:GGDEF domain-containing response regulator n=1 Tax=Thiohalorhabdus sp. TaxID=3094134 RepID=UPI00397FFF5E